ncbi:MAG: helix-turn-helix transcriptional regulator [Thermoguttaceae bacterium]|nr:helix-turn-helix transcriptional regulator [Thermoguttaceae bacterium]
MEILKRYRNGGLTQEEFAAECEISRAYYGRLERGEHSATLELCEKIANYLDVTYAQLFEMLDD